MSMDAEARRLIENLRLGRAATAACPDEDLSKTDERDKLDRMASEMQIIKVESERTAEAAQLELSALRKDPTLQQMQAVLETLKSSQRYFDSQAMMLRRQIDELQGKINERFGQAPREAVAKASGRGTEPPEEAGAGTIPLA